MAKDEESTEVQSSVQYKRFDNVDADDDNTTTNEVASAATEAPPTGTPETNSADKNDARGDPKSGDQHTSSNGQSPPDGATNKEVILQMNGSAGRTKAVHEPVWNWLNLVVSVASIFCCSVCGVLATVTSVLAYVDHRIGDFSAAHHKRVASYALALSALIAGLICMIIIVLVAIHLDNKPT